MPTPNETMTEHTPGPMQILAAKVAADFIAEWDDMDSRARQGGGVCFSYDDVRDRTDAISGGDLDCFQLDMASDMAHKILNMPESKARAAIAKTRAIQPATVA